MSPRGLDWRDTKVLANSKKHWVVASIIDQPNQQSRHTVASLFQPATDTLDGSKGYAYLRLDEALMLGVLVNELNFIILPGDSDRQPEYSKTASQIGRTTETVQNPARTGWVRIKNLGQRSRRDELFETFSSFGDVFFCHILNRIGYINYRNINAADAAVKAWNGMTFKDRNLCVEHCPPLAEMYHRRAAKSKDLEEKKKEVNHRPALNLKDLEDPPFLQVDYFTSVLAEDMEDMSDDSEVSNAIVDMSVKEAAHIQMVRENLLNQISPYLLVRPTRVVDELFNEMQLLDLQDLLTTPYALNARVNSIAYALFQSRRRGKTRK